MSRNKSIVEQKRGFKFLLGLNSNLDEVRGQILGSKNLPNLRAAFSAVRQEESHRKVMLGPVDALALVTHHHPFFQSDASSISNDAEVHKALIITANLGRDVFGAIGAKSQHIDTCWKIHGKLANGKHVVTGVHMLP